MALSTKGFGLKPVNKIGSNYNAAQVTEYKGTTYYGNGIGFQSPVVLESNGFGSPGVSAATVYVGNKVSGSFMGCQFVDDVTKKPIFSDNLPDSVAKDAGDSSFNFRTILTGNHPSYFVADDPFQLYEMKIDGVLTMSNYLENYGISRGGYFDNNTGLSEAKVESATGDNNSFLPIKIHSLPTTAGDDVFDFASAGGYTDNKLAANSNVIVMLNNSLYKERSIT